MQQAQALKVPMNKTTMTILANFYTMNKDGNFKFSERKHEEFIKKLIKK